MKILGVIPARYQSSRFEGKPLVMIAGVPMLKRTYLQARQASLLTDLIVATDDDRIYEYCKTAGIPVQMTSTECKTGTDRVSEVAQRTDYDLYINIQGDEPVIDPSTIEDVVRSYNAHGDKYVAYNMYKEIDEDKDAVSPTVIKVAINLEDELLYMSRLPLPYQQGATASARYKQVCVYGFTKRGLSLFSSRGKTPFEASEDVEILRFLEMGHKVRMIPTKASSLSVDRPEDVVRVEQWLLEKGRA